MKKIEADIIIIAGGMSGISAAAAAAEKGVSVIVFEKSGTLGGTANMGMGFFGVESHIQKRELNNDLTVEKAFKLFMEYIHWRADARLIRKLFGQSASTVKWIEDMGVEFLGAFKYFKESEATWHIPKMPGSNKPAERASSLIVKALSDRCKELEVEFHFNTSAKKIIREDGVVIGVMAEDADGNEILAECDAVIVCSGGFGDNPDMIKENLGYDHGKDLFSFRIPGLAGEGMQMVWDIGGGKSPFNIEMTYESPGMTGGYLVDAIMHQPNLMVNLDGRRFINEEIMQNTPYTGNAINLQRERVGIVIVTDEIIESYRDTGLDYTSFHKGGHSTIDGWKETFDSFLKGNGHDELQAANLGQLVGLKGGEKFFFSSDSLEGLAGQIGIDKESFLKTVEEYNHACDITGDFFFYKDRRYMKPLRGKTYYAMKFYPAGYGSLGGIKVNDKLEVVTQEGDKISGLYSAGTDCCNIFGDSYCFYLPGSTMGFAINSGRMAGYNAVDWLDSTE